MNERVVPLLPYDWTIEATRLLYKSEHTSGARFVVTLLRMKRGRSAEHTEFHQNG